MPFQSQRAKLTLLPETKEQLNVISRSRTESAQRVERAKILLAYEAGQTISAIAKQLSTNRPKVERCIAKALELGALAALADLPGRGKPAVITDEDRAWVVSLACQKPKDLGYSYELWTTKLLAEHVRAHCLEQGHPALACLARGTISKILSANKIRPHKISYYLERRDAEFESKMAQVLFVYKEVELLREKKEQGADPGLIAVLSYDEKPGIQAIENTAPDLPPVPEKHSCVGRDYEYVRHGTLSLLAGIDLLSGHVHGLVSERHRSREFIDFLKLVDGHYPAGTLIRIVLDNHSAHISKETQGWLAGVPNRFEFVFTPKHGSWLNMIESFFGKMAKTMLRGIRVASKAELKSRIMQYLSEINESPVVFRWKYRLEEISVGGSY
jgi:transposase